MILAAAGGDPNNPKEASLNLLTSYIMNVSNSGSDPVGVCPDPTFDIKKTGSDSYLVFTFS